MSDKKYSRKEFFNIFKSSENKKSNSTKETENKAPILSKEKENFLNEYVLWLKEFEAFVATRKDNTFDLEQNKKIMQIAAKIEEKKPQLENHMKDPLFVKRFHELSSKITQKI